MYGSIFSMKPKEGQKEALIELLQGSPNNSRMVAWFVMNPDDDGDLMGVAIFKDKESYKVNAEKEETHQNFLEMMEFLEEEPSWNDGSFVVGEFI
ncbi:MAG: hypothetical protein CL762_05070 [Chloroflexi bacterium]|nr:hypothetical protein [Chloroflexota bacterium]MBM02069.1 hypothetical protein [Chloroflexota bacterium]